MEPGKEKIEEYITGLHKKYKHKTVKRKIASIKAYYNYLEEEEIIAENPLSKFKETVILPRTIPREEIEQILNYMYKCLDESDKSAYKFRLRDIAVVETFFATGARVYEISNIREDSINLNTGLIRLMGKGGKERYVQISNTSVLETLKKYYAENVQAIKKSGYFFVNRRGNRFTEQSMRLMLKKYTKLVGIERNITPHMFRHTYATLLMKNDINQKAVAAALGHSKSIITVDTYTDIQAIIADCVQEIVIVEDESVTAEDDAEQESKEEAAPVIIVYDYSDVTEMDDIAEWYLEEEVA